MAMRLGATGADGAPGICPNVLRQEFRPQPDGSAVRPMRRSPALLAPASIASGLIVVALLGMPLATAWAQGKSHQAPGRQRGNPYPGQGKGHGGKKHDADDHRDGDRKRWEWESWDRDRWRDYDRNVRYNHWSTPVRINPYATRAPWATRNWADARPWPTGSYGNWNQPPWPWWPDQSALWGVRSLAARSLINQALDRALGWNQPMFPVPSTPWRLVYGSLQPVGYGSVGFVVSNGGSYYRMTASCDSGLLNGQVPSTYAQAQLIHAACQVAYGAPAY